MCTAKYLCIFLNQMPHSFILMSSSAWTDLWCPFSGLCKIEDIITSDLFRWIIFIILINSSATCNRTWVCKRDREFPYSCKGTPKATQQHLRHFCGTTEEFQAKGWRIKKKQVDKQKKIVGRKQAAVWCCLLKISGCCSGSGAIMRHTHAFTGRRYTCTLTGNRGGL